MHPEMVALMHEALDGEALQTGWERLNAHLADCRDCARAWATLNEAHTVLKQAPVVAPAAHLPTAIARRIARESGAVSVRWERARLAITFLLLAMLPASMLLATGSAVVFGSWGVWLSGFLALIQWGAAWTAVLGAFARATLLLAGAGPLAVSFLLSLAALVIWARLLDSGVAPIRLGRGAGGSQ